MSRGVEDNSTQRWPVVEILPSDSDAEIGPSAEWRVGLTEFCQRQGLQVAGLRILVEVLVRLLHKGAFNVYTAVARNRGFDAHVFALWVLEDDFQQNRDDFWKHMRYASVKVEQKMVGAHIDERGLLRFVLLAVPLPPGTQRPERPYCEIDGCLSEDTDGTTLFTYRDN